MKLRLLLIVAALLFITSNIFAAPQKGTVINITIAGELAHPPDKGWKFCKPEVSELCLSLTYDMVVKGHGGTIDVSSREGAFTGFIISLPL
jgi:hypothetical protein